MDRQVEQLNGKVIGIEQKTTQKGDPMWKIKIGYGDKINTLNTKEEPTIKIGDDGPFNFTRSTFNSPTHGEIEMKWLYTDKWEENREELKEKLGIPPEPDKLDLILTGINEIKAMLDMQIASKIKSETPKAINDDEINIEDIKF